MGRLGKGGYAARHVDEPVKTVLSHQVLLLASRLVLGSVFFVATMDKIAAPAAFAESVFAYGMVPYSLINIFSLVIPWIELLCGVFLVSGLLVRPSSALLSI